MTELQLDLNSIRDRALEDMTRGPVTSSYDADVDGVVEILSHVLATEIVCWLRYQQHALVAAGIDRGPVAAEFVEHAGEELAHALWVAERINQLGGTPDLDPDGLTSRSQTAYVTFDDVDLEGMLRENLLAERVVIQIYRAVIRWLGEADPTTRRLLERILEQEEEHADDLRDLLGRPR